MTVQKKSKNGKFISTPEQLFARHCIKGAADECWVWRGHISSAGYGQARIGGRKGKLFQAHRISWTIHFGEIQNGLHVLHKCDNRPCVNPNHLFLGTNNDNIADRVAKGRSNRWIATAPREKHPRAIIFKEQLDEMIRLRANKVKVVTIAKQFNICKEHCSKLLVQAKKGELSWYF